MIFSGKTVVVTGAGSGVGRSLAVGFSADGADVIGIGRRREALEQTARLCAGKMTFQVGDVAARTEVERFFAGVFERFGKVDVLINNAALYPKEPFLGAPVENWIRTIDTNVVGMALCCRAVLPGMLERGFGRILNLGSFAWRGPIPGASAYSVSKAAVHALTLALVTEIDRVRYPDVLINEFLPGIVKTSMSDTGIDPDEVYPHARAVVALPSGSPTGQLYLQSTHYVEDGGRLARWRRRVKRAIKRVAGPFLTRLRR